MRPAVAEPLAEYWMDYEKTVSKEEFVKLKWKNYFEVDYIHRPTVKEVYQPVWTD